MGTYTSANLNAGNANSSSIDKYPGLLFSMSYFLKRPISCMLSEIHQSEANIIPTTLEAGSTIVEHRVVQPQRVTVSFEVNNIGYGPEHGGLLLFDLEQMLSNGDRYYLYTDHQVYISMCVEQVQGVMPAPFKGKLQYQVIMKQVNYFTPESKSNFYDTAIKFGPEMYTETRALSFSNNRSAARVGRSAWYGYKGDLLGYREGNSVNYTDMHLESPRINQAQDLVILNAAQSTDVSMATRTNTDYHANNPNLNGRASTLEDNTYLYVGDGDWPELVDNSYNRTVMPLSAVLYQENLMKAGYTADEAKREAVLRATLNEKYQDMNKMIRLQTEDPDRYQLKISTYGYMTVEESREDIKEVQQARRFYRMQVETRTMTKVDLESIYQTTKSATKW